MTVFTRTWNAAYEALPSDTDNISEGAQRIRNTRADIKERLVVDHSWAGDAKDGKHKKINWIDQASSPGTPDPGQAVSYGKPRGATTGIYTKHETGFVLPGIDGGAEAIVDADKTLTNEEGGLVLMTPTAERTITLPTTNVGMGWTVIIVNRAATKLLAIRSSNGDLVTRTMKGIITLIAFNNTPTARAHWVFKGGGPHLLDTQEASASAQLDFKGIDASYDEYLFILSRILPTTDNQAFVFRVSTDGGSTFKSGASHYEHGGRSITAAGVPVESLSGSTVGTSILLSFAASGNVSDEGIDGELRLFSPSIGNKTRVLYRMSVVGFTSILHDLSGVGRYKADNVAVDAVRFLFGSGTIASGRISMYGIMR